MQDSIESVNVQGAAAEHGLRVIPITGASEFRAVSRREAAALLSVSDKSMERLVLRGQLPAFKVLGQWRILLSDLHKYIRQQRAATIQQIGV